jgi:hypothetical protein
MDDQGPGAYWPGATERDIVWIGLLTMDSSCERLPIPDDDDEEAEAEAAARMVDDDDGDDQGQPTQPPGGDRPEVHQTPHQRVLSEFELRTSLTAQEPSPPERDPRIFPMEDLVLPPDAEQYVIGTPGEPRGSTSKQQKQTRRSKEDAWRREARKLAEQTSGSHPTASADASLEAAAT